MKKCYLFHLKKTNHLIKLKDNKLYYSIGEISKILKLNTSLIRFWEKEFDIIQPKKNSNNSIPELYNIGCLGKITSFNESEDGRYLIILNGLSRFKIIDEIENNKLYRECNVSFNEFKNDINSNKEEIKFTDLELIFKNLKNLFQKKGYIINWKELEKQDLNQTINTLAMASPFSLEEKQALLETQNLISRKFKLEEIIKTYILDDFSNTTIQ